MSSLISTVTTELFEATCTANSITAQRAVLWHRLHKTTASVSSVRCATMLTDSKTDESITGRKQSMN